MRNAFVRSWVVLLAAFVSLAFVAPLGAATVTWDGGGDGVSWNDPANWSANQLPGPIDAVTVPGAFAGTTIVHAGGVTSVASFDGYRLHMAGGSLTVSGSCLIRSRLEYSGGTLVATPLLSNATLAGTGGGSPVTFVAAGSSSFEGNLAAGQVLVVRGGALITGASLLVSPDATSDGTVVLETVDGAWSATLAVSAGSTFTSRGELLVRFGTGGSRTITGDLRNEGRFAVEAGIGVVHNGSLRNEGDVEAAAGAILQLSNAASRTVEQVSGSIGGEGFVLVNAGSLRLLGGAVDREITARNASLEIGPGVKGEALVVAQGACTLVGNASPTTTVWVQGGGAVTGATLTTAPDAMNEGTIVMRTVAGAWSCALVVAEGEAFPNRGSILVEFGTAGPRTITGDLRNEGLLQVAADVTLVHGGNLRNEGEVAVDAGATLQLTNATNRLVEQASGSIGGEGLVLVNGGSLRLLGGAVDREITARNASLEIGPGVKGEALVIAQGGCTLLGNASPTTTVWVQGGGAITGATLTTAPDAMNEGTIVMRTIAGAWSCALVVAEGEAFPNRGSILVEFGTAGPRTITGDLRNEGLLKVDVNIALVHNGSLRNEGAVAVDAGATLQLANAANRLVEQAAGSIGGEGFVLVNGGSLRLLGGGVDREITARNASLEIGPGVKGEALVVAQGGCTLVGNASPTTTVWVQGGGFASANLTAAPDAMNEGTILMRTVAGAWTCSLTVPQGVTFSNRGILLGQTGTAGVHSIVGGGTFLNEGTVFPSVSVPLTLAGLFVQTADGFLRVRFEGTVPGTWSRLIVNAPATIAGTLAIERGPGFQPTPGAGFVCMTGNPIDGTFANAGGCGISAEVVVRATTVTCFVGDLACPGDLNLDGQVSAADLTILLGAWGPCEVPSACVGDLNCDGQVSAADLTILLGAWGACAP